MKSRALGDTALALIRDTASRLDQLDRDRLRALVDEKSIRPPVGTSQALDTGIVNTIGNGSRDVTVYDLVGMLSPVHLRGGKIDTRKERL